MQTENTDPFHRTTPTDRLADIIGTTLAVFYVLIAGLLIIAVFTIIGVEVASAIWGDYNVTYWLADLI